MQIPIVTGIYTDSDADFRISYPVNMRPIIKDTGLSAGYLRPVEGIVKTGTGPGVSRGAINWDGSLYRVMGSKLCRITSDGDISILGDVGNNSKQVSFAYSFERLAVASDERLFYLSNNTLEEVTDPDLGRVLDVTWVDGYFMTTDGAFLVVTDLSNPFNVNPLKYGSSEIDPDPVVAVVKLRNEIYAVNRYTIEVFNNVAGAFFPFQRVNGAQIQRGALGTHCVAVYEENLVFLGSAPGESPGVYIASSGKSSKLSSREIDDILDEYTEDQLSEVILDVVSDRGHALLWVRLPDKTLVFDGASSQSAGSPIWYRMSSSTDESLQPYRAIDVVWCYSGWQVADSQSFDIGVLDESISTHFGDTVYWEFSTSIVYNEGKGAQFHSIELVGLPGRVAFGEDAYISTSYSLDGMTWSQQRPLNIGTRGDRKRRLVWRRQGSMRNFRIQKFTGDSRAYLAIARLEVELEPLNA